MNKNILFEIKIENPNRPSNPLPSFAVAFALLLFFVSILSMHIGFVLFCIFFLLIVIILVMITSKTPKDATFQLIQLDEHTHSIKLSGKNLNLELNGELFYEPWLKPTKSNQTRHTYNVSNISILAPKKAQILIKSSNYSSHKTNWGIIRGASPYPIGIILKMDKSEIEAVKFALEKHQIKLSDPFSNS